MNQGDAYFDVTPIRETTAAGDVTFSAVNGSSTLTVADVNHGAIVNDFVTFSGAVTLGGNITAAVLNSRIPNSYCNRWKFLHRRGLKTQRELQLRLTHQTRETVALLSLVLIRSTQD